MIKFNGSFYLVKGKVKELVTSTGLGFDEDSRLESYEKAIATLLEKLVNKNSAIEKKGFRWTDTSGKNSKARNVSKVYFVECEDLRWLESGSFKGDVEFIIVESKMNSFTFKKDLQVFAKMDAKELAGIKNMDEVDYS